jgi:hypothetical protein
VYIGLNDVDGSLAWERDIPNAVDNYQLAGDVLYVISLNEILLINPVNGELINCIVSPRYTLFLKNKGQP